MDELLLCEANGLLILLFYLISKIDTFLVNIWSPGVGSSFYTRMRITSVPCLAGEISSWLTWGGYPSSFHDLNEKVTSQQKFRQISWTARLPQLFSAVTSWMSNVIQEVKIQMRDFHCRVNFFRTDLWKKETPLKFYFLSIKIKWTLNIQQKF